jgi:putative FmdB family regulatory protein
MPNYDYKCEACGHLFEVMLKVAQRKKPCKADCPSCGQKKVEQVIGVPGLCDGFRIGTLKHDSGFKEVLAKVKQHNPKFESKDL